MTALTDEQNQENQVTEHAERTDYHEVRQDKHSTIDQYQTKKQSQTKNQSMQQIIKSNESISRDKTNHFQGNATKHADKTCRKNREQGQQPKKDVQATATKIQHSKQKPARASSYRPRKSKIDIQGTVNSGTKRTMGHETKRAKKSKLKLTQNHQS